MRKVPKGEGENQTAFLLRAAEALQKRDAAAAALAEEDRAIRALCIQYGEMTNIYGWTPDQLRRVCRTRGYLPEQG